MRPFILLVCFLLAPSKAERSLCIQLTLTTSNPTGLAPNHFMHASLTSQLFISGKPILSYDDGRLLLASVSMSDISLKGYSTKFFGLVLVVLVEWQRVTYATACSSPRSKSKPESLIRNCRCCLITCIEEEEPGDEARA